MAIASLSVTATAQTTGGDSKEIVFAPYFWGTALSGPTLAVDMWFVELWVGYRFAD